MSDAKKCDRCSEFYSMNDDIPKRGKINNKTVNYIGAYSGESTRCGYFDLCPECSKSFANWFDRVIEKWDDLLPEEIDQDQEHDCKDCMYSKKSGDVWPCSACNNYDRFVEGGSIKDVVF